MDLYSTDYGAIQEGNLRHHAVQQANDVIQQHNKNLGIQIANLKAQQKGAEQTKDLMSAAQQFWSSGKLPSQVTALQEHFAKGGTLFSNPTTQAQTKAENDLKDAQDSERTTTDNPAELSEKGEGALEDTKDLAEGEGLAGDFASKGMKALGGLGALAVGGYDIYKDIESIKDGHGIAGDNWAEKTSNILQIGGAISDLGGTVFPPLAVVGGVLDIASGVFGEVGSAMDVKKQSEDDDTLQQQNTETKQAVSTSQEVEARVQ